MMDLIRSSEYEAALEFLEQALVLVDEENQAVLQHKINVKCKE